MLLPCLFIVMPLLTFSESNSEQLKFSFVDRFDFRVETRNGLLSVTENSGSALGLRL